MESVTGKFKLSDSLEMLFPGFFLCGMLVPLFGRIDFGFPRDALFVSTVYVSSSLLSGALLFFIRLPHRFPPFAHMLCTTRVRRELAAKYGVSGAPHRLEEWLEKLIFNAFFDFYDKSGAVSDDQKEITSLYTSLYSGLFNTALCGAILALLYAAVGVLRPDPALFPCAIISAVFFAGSSAAVFLLLVTDSLGHFYHRQYMRFRRSAEYKRLVADSASAWKRLKRR